MDIAVSPKTIIWLSVAWSLLALVLFPMLLKIRAPYGRYSNRNWGPLIDNRTGWIIMELPSLLLFTLLSLKSSDAFGPESWLFFALWVMHYVNRIFIFPFRTRTSGKKMPLLIMLFALLFNLVNGFLNGYWLGFMSGSIENSTLITEHGAWLTNLRQFTGLTIFAAGFIINQVADNHLIRLRERGSGSYSIPKQRLFKNISCPNYAGEIIEWSGYAILTWSMPALSFAIWTAANLIPRAIHHHRWYKDHFPEYPESKKALFPGII